MKLTKEQEEFLDLNVKQMNERCRQCGKLINVVWNFCPWCGRSIL